MSREIHNGAKLWQSLYGRDEPVSRDSVVDFLLKYFDDVIDHTPDYLKLPRISRAVFIWREFMFEVQRSGAYNANRSYDLARIFRDIDTENLTSSAARTCVFVSHRHTDLKHAMHLSNAIKRHGKHDVWLDVWDPALGLAALSPFNSAFLTALIIEMGLISSVGVIALITDKAHGSAWIPYEFGRVKTGGPFAKMASVCLGRQGVRVQEYMLLSPIVRRTQAGHYDNLNSWLNSL